MIIIDSREKEYSHIKDYFDKHNVEYKIEKLDTADYMNTDNPNILIDRKHGLQEICGNLSRGKSNHTRFTKECKRAFENQQRFIVLIEGTRCKQMSDVTSWRSKYSNHTGRWLVNEMFRLYCAYKVEWVFCKSNETARKILELLEYDNG